MAGSSGDWRQAQPDRHVCVTTCEQPVSAHVCPSSWWRVRWCRAPTRLLCDWGLYVHLPPKSPAAHAKVPIHCLHNAARTWFAVLPSYTAAVLASPPNSCPKTTHEQPPGKHYCLKQRHTQTLPTPNAAPAAVPAGGARAGWNGTCIPQSPTAQHKPPHSPDGAAARERLLLLNMPAEGSTAAASAQPEVCLVLRCCTRPSTSCC